jgi:hypothetical protein
LVRECMPFGLSGRSLNSVAGSSLRTILNMPRVARPDLVAACEL